MDVPEEPFDLDDARREFEDAFYRIFDKDYGDNIWFREAIEKLIDAKVAIALKERS